VDRGARGRPALRKDCAAAVVYRLAVFGSAGDGRPADEPAALGRFVHVYVDRDTRRPAPIPERIAAALEALTPSGRADAGRAQTSAPARRRW